MGREKEEKMGEVEAKIKMEKSHKEGRKAVEINYVLDTLTIQTLSKVSIRNAFLSSFYRRGTRG